MSGQALAGEVACSVRLASGSPDGTSAIACIELECNGDGAAAALGMDELLVALGIAPLAIGGTKVVSIGGIDRAFVVRWKVGAVTVMPHAGPVIVAAVLEFLLARGGPLGLVAGKDVQSGGGGGVVNEAAASGAALCARYLHEALAMAASPGAIDLLLDQPRRWAGFAGDWHEAAVLARAKVLARLLREPTVAVVGPPNVGKSSLLNALAGRSAAIVADEAGTTRDHVGVSLVLGHGCGGLAVRWLDTPGVAPDGAGSGGDELVELSWRGVLPLVRRADLVVLCGDAGQPAPDAGWLGLPSSTPVLRVALRADWGLPQWRYDVAVGGLGVSPIVAGGGAGLGAAAFGLAALIERVGEALLSREMVDCAGPWAFWAG